MSRSLPLTTSGEASSATVPYEKSKGNVDYILCGIVASIIIPMLYEMLDEMRYEMILLYGQQYSTIKINQKKKKIIKMKKIY